MAPEPHIHITRGYQAPHPAYRIEGPALISFSGGRTSAYMLHEILRAHDGRLPVDVHVTFANTGKERLETLRFVHDCATHWNVNVRWLEWRSGEHGSRFEEVGFNSASREGEPFSALIAHKGYLPNALTRYCTLELKIRVMRDFARSVGFEHWTNVVGLRRDEPSRVMKAVASNAAKKERWQASMPLAEAGVAERDIRAFWRAQPFDLGLQSFEGNCDLCFLKARGKLKSIIRTDPVKAMWWTQQETDESALRDATEAGSRFRSDETYADLVRQVASSPLLDLEPGDDKEFDAECGLWCAA